MTWDTIIGQHRVKRILRSSLENNRLAHAYLFSGVEGLGKSAMAIELAKTLNCEKGTIDACGKCRSCTKFITLQHPNVHVVFPLPAGKNEKYGDDPIAKLPDDDVTLIQEEIREKAVHPYHQIVIPKANSIKINSVREIRKESSMSIFEKGKRVFIILDVEQLTDEAANALLKTLEEPHEDTLLILTASQPDSLLPTIVSRCQHIRFDPVAEDDIRTALVEREGSGEQDAALIAKLANGSYGRALELSGAAFQERRAEAIALLRTFLYGSRTEILTEINRIDSEYEKVEIEELLLLLQSWLHEAMLVREGTLQQPEVMDGETLEKFTAHHPDVDYTLVFGTIGNAISLLNKNVYIPLILINLALELRVHIASPSEKQRSAGQVGMQA